MRTELKQSVIQLIQKGEIDSAVELIRNNQPSNDETLLVSRYHNVKKSYNLGLISYADFQQIQSQVIYGLLDEFGYKEPTNNQSNNQSQLNSETMESQLLAFITKYRRVAPTIAEKAKVLLNSIRIYNDDKRTVPAFDPSGRRWLVLSNSYTELVKEAKDFDDDKQDSFVDDITALLNEDVVPKRETLRTIYAKLQIKGFESGYIEKMFASHDSFNDELAITIAELCEAFLKKLVA